VKGIGHDAHLLWEGSVPKFLGIQGAAPPEAAFATDRALQRLVPGLPHPSIRRCDLTHDVVDPDGAWRDAARGWNPHARSRYVEAVYNDGETVWQHNKTRGVRVYDKFAECGEDWAVGLTRVEYQVRGDWLGKLGLDRLYEDFDLNVKRALGPVVTDLMFRVPGWK